MPEATAVRPLRPLRPLRLWSLGFFALAARLLVRGEGGEPAEEEERQWYEVPLDDLSAFEALEYAVLRINEMRSECGGFHLAALERHSYKATEVYVKDMGPFSIYRLHIASVNHLAPSPIRVDMAQQHSVTDMSLFEVLAVRPPPCDLYSALDDAELMVPRHSQAVKRARRAAMEALNSVRKVLCRQRPQLQFIRVVAASQQPAEGVLFRLTLEMREAFTSFQASSFIDEVSVVYALDQNIPGQCTVSPEVYPSRRPCKMRYTEEEQGAGSNSSSAEAEEEGRRLRGTNVAANFGEDPAEASAAVVPAPRFQRHLRDLRASAPKATAAAAAADSAAAGAAGAPRRLESWYPSDMASTGAHVERQFVDRGLDIPTSFDPRLEQTLCFPRGVSRRQGSCGASWAFAATAVASFRECLWHLHNGRLDSGLAFFSAQELTSCNERDGCSGGSASSAFYFMKRYGLAREDCSAYRMRCFVDASPISVAATDEETASSEGQPPQEEGATGDAAAGDATEGDVCPRPLNPRTSPCRCLPSAYHLTRPIECSLLPNACPKTKVPHYFKIAGTVEGNTVPQLERHLMQEILEGGPLYVSVMLWEDFYDPVSWSESGVYVHQRGGPVGKHACVLVGWGTDANNRDYWLLLNSYGEGWQQEGYFKVMRGESSLDMAKFGAWGVDWSNPEVDKTKPSIIDVEVTFSSETLSGNLAAPSTELSNVWMQVSAFTDEPARLLARLEGFSSAATAQVRDTEFTGKHVLRVDLLQAGVLGDRAKLQLWAEDPSENTATWGPFTLAVPGPDAFRVLQARRLAQRLDNLTLRLPLLT